MFGKATWLTVKQSELERTPSLFASSAFWLLLAGILMESNGNGSRRVWSPMGAQRRQKKEMREMRTGGGKCLSPQLD